MMPLYAQPCENRGEPVRGQRPIHNEKERLKRSWTRGAGGFRDKKTLLEVTSSVYRHHIDRKSKRKMQIVLSGMQITYRIL